MPEQRRVSTWRRLRISARLIGGLFSLAALVLLLLLRPSLTSPHGHDMDVAATTTGNHAVRDEANTKWVTATDRSSRIAVPKNWSKMKLNHVATIELGNEGLHQYLLVISDNKASVPEDLNRFARNTAGRIASGLRSKKVSAPRQLHIGGRLAVQYEIRGVVDNLNIVYWHTSIEGMDHYFQVIAWTVASHAVENGPKLRGVVMTFRENRTFA